ncbi:biotin-dependent carboxyltransferase family protein [Rhodococcus sp. G-MC3]|uniref:5-oxoprolinase subunit C family protein n=1 Tax=Rhodococcus sp. G-MC3 TaxID=3046209 RepID=UPI0024B9AE4E|nr:biotin-dependent carboxyltransferase family protein [Rhodococcus sp. G-MC3]MDJ0393403.1 biotin-dependent carboxyltransferase family protein [Rhodococcus sp. G-MC3]
MNSLEIVSPGPLCTVQDRGRPGYSAIGVGRSGAADASAHDAANRLVGNAVEAATLEATMGGLRIRAHGRTVVAVTGAECSITVNGVADGTYCTIVLSDGDELTVGTPASGLRTYLAVRGGVGVEPVLGSRSTDTLSGLGPAPVEAGSSLPIGDDASDWPLVHQIPPPTVADRIQVMLGPREDWFLDPTVLFTQEWTVNPDSNRVGVRLDGQQGLERSGSGELPSEGMVSGALQVPPDGKPVLFLVDHPVTGGYPVVGVVRSDDLARLGQLRPGEKVRFAPVRV